MPAHFIRLIFLCGIVLSGCTTHGPDAIPGSRYVPPTTGSRAFVDVNNLSAYQVRVALFDNARTCAGRNAIHYDSDRDQQNKLEVAGYQDGKPFYYRYARIEGAELGPSRSLRSVALVPQATLMEISATTPADIRMNSGITTMKYQYCNYIFEFHPVKDARYSFDFNADAARQQCSMQAYLEVAAANGQSTRTPVSVKPRTCD